jgi:hypothetical protein
MSQHDNQSLRKQRRSNDIFFLKPKIPPKMAAPLSESLIEPTKIVKAPLKKIKTS